MGYETCSELLKAFDPLGSAACVYDIAMGYWWVFLLMIVMLFSVHAVIRVPAVTSILALLTSAMLLVYLPAVLHPILYLMIVLSFAATLYIVFLGKDRQ